MLVRFLEDGDMMLDKTSDFEIQTIHENGEIQDTNWHTKTTFNDIFNKFRKTHKKGIEISILDYGDELHAIITANAKSINHQYRVMMT